MGKTTSDDELVAQAAVLERLLEKEKKAGKRKRPRTIMRAER